MENLLAPQQPAPQQPAPQQPAPQQPAPQQPAPQQPAEGDDSATNDAILASLDILYQPDVISSISKSIESAATPARQIGDIAAKLVIQADEANGKTFTEDVIVPAAAAIVEEIISYVSESGQYQPAPKDEETAVVEMMQTLLQAYPVSEQDYNDFVGGLTDEALPDSIKSIAEQQGGANV